MPAGTGNDFAVEAGFPADPVAAVEVIAAALAAGRSRPVDLARMTASNGDERWYGTVLAAGYDAIVNERANRMRWPRGPRRYDLAILVELARLRARGYTLVLDGVEHRLDAVLVAVGNGASYGGGMRICPAADLTDGLLDVLVAGPISRSTLVRIKPRLYQGSHMEHPMVPDLPGAHRARGRRGDRRIRRRRARAAAAGDRDLGTRRAPVASLSGSAAQRNRGVGRDQSTGGSASGGSVGAGGGGQVQYRAEPVGRTRRS